NYDEDIHAGLGAGRFWHRFSFQPLRRTARMGGPPVQGTGNRSGPQMKSSRMLAGGGTSPRGMPASTTGSSTEKKPLKREAALPSAIHQGHSLSRSSEGPYTNAS